MLQKFDEELEYIMDGEKTINARGPIELDTDPHEKPMVICVRIFQDDRLVAECNGAEPHHGQSFLPADDPRRWSCPGHVELESGQAPQDGSAIAMAVLVTGDRGGGFNTYTWTEIVKLKKVTAFSPDPHLAAVPAPGG